MLRPIHKSVTNLIAVSILVHIWIEFVLVNFIKIAPFFYLIEEKPTSFKPTNVTMNNMFIPFIVSEAVRVVSTAATQLEIDSFD